MFSEEAEILALLNDASPESKAAFKKMLHDAKLSASKKSASHSAANATGAAMSTAPIFPQASIPPDKPPPPQPSSHHQPTVKLTNEEQQWLNERREQQKQLQQNPCISKKLNLSIKTILTQTIV